MREIQASDFKAKCLALLDEVKRTGVVLTILKRGKPVAQLGPVIENTTEIPQHTLMGSVTILGDIVNPALEQSEIDLESGKL